MRRRVLIAVGVVVFMAISFQLARFLTAENAERAAVFSLLVDEAHGDTIGVATRLAGCEATCMRQLGPIVARAKRPGDVKILRLDSGSSFSLGEKTGVTRVAWAADAERGGVAVVQCVTVRRKWGVLSGASVTLLRLSAPLPPEKGC